MPTASKINIIRHGNCWDGHASSAIWMRANGDTSKGSYSFVAGKPNGDLPLQSGLNVVLDLPYVADSRVHFWADHHATAFRTSSDRAHFQANLGSRKIYDVQYKSCAKLLADKYAQGRVDGLRELVNWSEIIDGAGFASAKQAVDGSNPMVALMTWVETNTDPNADARVIEEMASGTSLTAIASRYLGGAALNGASDLSRWVSGSDGQKVVFIDLTGRGPGWYNKLSPFAAAPSCVFAVVVSSVRDGGVKVAVGRNPWSRGRAGSESLGLLCQKKAGGGGHQNAGGFGGPASDRARLTSIARDIAGYLERCP
jgi:hypothetical protein